MRKGQVPVIDGVRLKPIISAESFTAFGVIIAIFLGLSLIMGFSNAIGTLFDNATWLFVNVVIPITAMAVLAGALSGALIEFGIIAMANKALAPLIKPIYGLPGASAIGLFTSYLSDNPAILALANNRQFRSYYKKYQLPALCNFGTSFGMGLIITISFLSISGENFGIAVLVGNAGAILGSIISTRLMLLKSKKVYGVDDAADDSGGTLAYDPLKYREVRDGSWGSRLFDSLLEGGAGGARIGLGIIPGVLIICSIMLILIDPAPQEYTGVSRQGIEIFQYIGNILDIIIKPLFGFTDSSFIAVPLTALGSAGAAIGVVRGSETMYRANDIAVFTSILMCWSGYLSTHVAMMDSLKFRNLTGSAILFHTIAGIAAGIFSNYLFQLITLLL